MNGGKTGALGGAQEWIGGVRFPAKADRLRLVRALSAAAAETCGCGRRAGDDIVRAVDEACQNVIRHAYGTRTGKIAVDVWKGGGRVEFHIRDHAPAVDAAQIGPRSLDDLRPGGLGTHLIGAVMDEVRFDPLPDGETGNLLKLVKYLDARGGGK